MVTKQELVEWADQEGGWASFIQRGVPTDEIPEDIRAEWNDAVRAWNAFDQAIDLLKSELPSL